MGEQRTPAPAIPTPQTLPTSQDPHHQRGVADSVRVRPLGHRCLPRLKRRGRAWPFTGHETGPSDRRLAPSGLFCRGGREGRESAEPAGPVRDAQPCVPWPAARRRGLRDAGRVLLTSRSSGFVRNRHAGPDGQDVVAGLGPLSSPPRAVAVGDVDHPRRYGVDATSGWSWPTTPTRAAPPGAPSSSKNSTLILAKWAHASGTSSS